ncbi:MAG: nicotinate phosphoribosyltransferase [Nitrosomonas sp.]|nr:nicotinate phosphoribosyltransferase [Nitrosomonas sp.]MDP1951107.1 nicotinate phosphoribosyltransferase [Nitrosomonas sp.]
MTSVLLTDIYQLTMLQAYYAQRMNEVAVFEFFVRRLPASRNFLIAAGLQQVTEFLENLHFSDSEISYLRSTRHFDEAFLDSLSTLRFTGDVDAMPEGTVFFKDETILRVIAPLPQAQLVESRIINLLHFQTLIASKAVRCALQAPNKLLVDFGMRRAHGAEAALLAARASYIAGFSGTATLLAGKMFGIPLFGTMAHSFVQTHARENDAFIHFALSHADNVTLLIDTYNTEAAASELGKVAKALSEHNITIKGVRLDSGDLADHAKKVRRILDQQNLRHVTIFSSGNIDEHVLNQLLQQQQAPIDGFGIGTLMDTSADAPYLDCAYKLQEYAGIARRKRSEGKATWPGRKQVYRYYGPDGLMTHDILTTLSDVRDAHALLQPIMREGKRLNSPETLETIRQRLRAEIAAMPEMLKELQPYQYHIEVSDELKSLVQAVDQQQH